MARPGSEHRGSFARSRRRLPAAIALACCVSAAASIPAAGERVVHARPIPMTPAPSRPSVSAPTSATNDPGHPVRFGAARPEPPRVIGQPQSSSGPADTPVAATTAPSASAAAVAAGATRDARTACASAGGRFGPPARGEERGRPGPAKRHEHVGRLAAACEQARRRATPARARSSGHSGRQGAASPGRGERQNGSGHSVSGRSGRGAPVLLLLLASSSAATASGDRAGKPDADGAHRATSSGRSPRGGASAPATGPRRRRRPWLRRLGLAPRLRLHPVHQPR